MEDRLNQLLWGYPKLIGEFYANVEPVLAPNRERIDREREKRAARRYRSSTNADDPPCSPSEDLDKRASPLTGPDSDDLPSPNTRSGSSDEITPQARLKVEFSPTNHPSSSDERQQAAVESRKSDVQRAQSGSGEAAEAPSAHSNTDHEVSLALEERATNASSE